MENQQKNENQIAMVIGLGLLVVAGLYYVGSLDFNPVQAIKDAMPEVIIIKK